MTDQRDTDVQDVSPHLVTLRRGLSRLFGVNSPIFTLIRRNRLMFCVMLCSGVSLLSFTLAFVVRFDLSSLDSSPISWGHWWLKTLPLVLVLRLAVFLLFGLHRVTWRYASVHDVIPVFASVLLSSALMVPLVLAMWNGVFPRSILAIDAILNLLLLAGVRFSYRIADEILAGLGAGRREKVIVVGGGAAGNLTVRAMLSRADVDYWPVAILDDDPYKQGTTIHGVPVLGTIDDVGEVARMTRAKAIVMALPSAATRELYKIVRICKETGLPLKTIPDLAHILSGSSEAIARISEFKTENLLHRRPIRKDVPEIQQFLSRRSVLVTGAAGSIGSELCRQIAEQGTELLVCLDRDENGLFRLEHDLKKVQGQTRTIFYLADMRNRLRLEQLFATYRPELVFHAAAYKHVPVLQHHPVEAVGNNVGGTSVLAELSDIHGVETFLLISTDKAVNPTSVMGASKRIAERIVRARNQRSATRFCAIRFGNVLGSNGSVVELFQKQIREGKPVTVTHVDIERYFMTIPEAVHLVLYETHMGRGGETYILDMGRPIKIDQLARELVKLSGLTPDVDVPIVYTGLRPGEKLYEELWTEEETPGPTTHPGILVAPPAESLPDDLDREVTRLLEAAAANDVEVCWESILQLVPTFQGNTSSAAPIPPDQRSESSA